MTSRHHKGQAILALIPRRSPVAINLALQGGGAHGAFTWGVLDRLLEDGRFAPEGISGTSAGALNAVALASGWLESGGEGASTARLAGSGARSPTSPACVRCGPRACRR